MAETEVFVQSCLFSAQIAGCARRRYERSIALLSTFVPSPDKGVDERLLLNGQLVRRSNYARLNNSCAEPSADAIGISRQHDGRWRNPWDPCH